MRSLAVPTHVLFISRSLAMLVFLLPALASIPTAQAQGQAVQGSRNLGPMNIVVSGRFLEVWSAAGSEQASVYINGWPITERRPEISLEDGKTYDVQWFERARYEFHPQNKPPYDVLLGRLGANLVEGRGRTDPQTQKVRSPEDEPFVGINMPADVDGRTKLWFPESRHTISGTLLEYWRKYGGLQQFGFPLSEPFEEPSPTDGKSYTVQYFERARFELHPDNPAPYEVELGLLGVQQHRLNPVPAEQLSIAPPTGEVSAKDTLVMGSMQEPNSLVGFEESGVVTARFTDAITFQDRLVHADDKGGYFPLAAWYVPTLENGGSYFAGSGENRHLVTKYKLRHGIQWADGKELTSSDAIFAYKFLLANPNVVSNELQKKIYAVDNPDKYTVIYRWMSAAQARVKYNDPRTDKAAYAFLKLFVERNAPVVDKAYFMVGMVLPEHVLRKLPFDKLFETDFARSPVGYGPYRVQSWKQGQEMVLVRNENYNLTNKPLIKTIVSLFQTDVNQNVSQFLLDKLDAIAGDAFVVPPERCPDIVQAGGTCATQPGASWEHLTFQLGYPPFQDKRVRQAMIHAINREQINSIVFKGAGVVLNGPTPTSVYFSLENVSFASVFPELAAKYSLPRYPYDPAAARKLLDEAGWLSGPDGIRQKNGEKLSFEYGTSRNATRQAIQALVQADLKSVGIDAITVNIPCSWVGPCGDPRPSFSTGKLKLIETAGMQTERDGYDQFSTDQLWSPENPERLNLQQYKNDKVTEANRNFHLEIDRAKVAEAAAIAQVEIMNDIAVIPLVQRPNIEIYRNTLQNRKLSNGTASQWWNITQWYFK